MNDVFMKEYERVLYVKVASAGMFVDQAFDEGIGNFFKEQMKLGPHAVPFLSDLSKVLILRGVFNNIARSLEFQSGNPL